MTLTVAPVLAESAERRPDHPALVLGSERITYAGLWNATRRYATALRDDGCAPGRPDRPAAAEHTALPDGVLRVPALGAVAVPVHGQLRADESVHVLGDSALARAGAEDVDSLVDVKSRDRDA
ncbi:AMP-binding protein [Streptomyces sp. NBC_00322]|uniref:AMP-binding protein n=1 Tax=Streptomyces sp. NBC_00322 TaxID=2975712 RepID=UPI002E28F569|nr:AMP-binding protein [Streptomyces sp. NBC_00322]